VVGDCRRNKPAGGGRSKDRPSRSKNKPQRGEAQERHEPGHGVTSAVRRRALARGKAERRRNPPYWRACTSRRTGSKPSSRRGIAGMQFHRAGEQPLKGQAQERRWPEIRPARLDREQTVARVTKPWRRTEAGRQSPRNKWTGPAGSAVGRKTSRESPVAERRPAGDGDQKR